MNADFLVSDAFVRDGIFGWALSALYVHGVLVEHPQERATSESTVKAVTLLHRLEHQRKKTQRGAIWRDSQLWHPTWVWTSAARFGDRFRSHRMPPIATAGRSGPARATAEAPG